jgi:hypothetical protein
MVDASSYSSTVTPTSVTYDVGVRGQAIVLTPQSLLPVTTTTGQPFAAADVSIEAWVRLRVLPVSRYMVFDNEQSYAMYIDATGHVICAYTGGSVVGTAVALSAGVWTHVACTETPTSATAYVNGVPVGTGAVPNVTFVQNAVVIGSNAPISVPMDFFDGAMDSLRLWRVALTATEVCTAAGSC